MIVPDDARQQTLQEDDDEPCRDDAFPRDSAEISAALRELKDGRYHLA